MLLAVSGWADHSRDLRTLYGPWLLLTLWLLSLLLTASDEAISFTHPFHHVGSVYIWTETSEAVNRNKPLFKLPTFMYIFFPEMKNWSVQGPLPY